jgi:CubicO group peptidase (beta-lactamase class C family)
MITRRLFLQRSVPFIASIGTEKKQLLASVATATTASSAGSDKLEHIFDLQPSSWDPWVKALLARIPQVMKETSVPGCSLALIRDAKIYWRSAFGVRDAETREPVDSDTVFQAASMSKSVFAYVVMKLAEKGVIGLDVPLTHYTKERYVPNDPRLDLITARHVLMHSTGFPDWRTPNSPMAISFTPGEKFSYSGEGYCYLQSVITHLTGHVDRKHCGAFENDVRFCATDIGDYLQERLLRPFQMDSSTYLSSERIEKNQARPHNEKGEPLPVSKAVAAAVVASRYAAAGGLSTTPSDFAKFLIAVISPPPPDEFHLSRKSRDEMIRPQISVSQNEQFSVFWGLGWRIVRMGQHKLIGHGGENPGFQCFAEVSPTRKCGFVIMTNSEAA